MLERERGVASAGLLRRAHVRRKLHPRAARGQRLIRPGHVAGVFQQPGLLQPERRRAGPAAQRLVQRLAGEGQVRRPHPDQLGEITDGVGVVRLAVDRLSKRAFSRVQRAQTLSGPANHQPGLRRIQSLGECPTHGGLGFGEALHVAECAGQIVLGDAAARRGLPRPLIERQRLIHPAERLEGAGVGGQHVNVGVASGGERRH